MKLSYRGVRYDYKSINAEILSSRTIDQYEGISTDLKTSREEHLSDTLVRLKYRGIVYIGFCEF
ncbi:MAG: DUF4278 domain-containing protein [Scytolyngbya sp. HA4215-MV1]|jgi:hypothetical protein|nr:DUF4278 domain-containing protein [Scytolyngbya sp. HA4215-MV1]